MPSYGKVCFGLPLYGNLPSLSVAHLISHVAQGIAQAHYGRFVTMEGAYVDHARNQIVNMALDDSGADDITHLFFVDQDVIIPDGAITTLLERGKDVVGGAYFGRDPNHKPVAFDIQPFARLDGFEDEEGLNKVGGIGMGATLISLDLLRRMKAELDITDDEGNTWWFRCSDNPDLNERRTGEDIWFAHRCAEMGVPIYLDASVRCGHVGAFSIGWDHFKAAQEARNGVNRSN